MFELMHISDLHFGKPFIPEVAETLLRTLERLRPPLLVISGDLTQRAKRREFRQARDFLQRLPSVPQVVVPGNHDVPLYRVWERFTKPHALYRRYISNDLDSVMHCAGEAVIVGLDSSSPYRAISNGRLSSRQLGYCVEALEQAPEGALRIVVLHHHLVPSPGFDRQTPMLQSKRMLDVLTQLRVDLVLSGHLHRAYVGNSLDVYSGPDRSHGIIVAQCGTTTSRRGRGSEQEKNTFNWVRLNDHTVEVTLYMYFAERDTFSPVSRHCFARPNRGFLQEGLEDEHDSGGH